MHHCSTQRRGPDRGRPAASGTAGARSGLTALKAQAGRTGSFESGAALLSPRSAPLAPGLLDFARHPPLLGLEELLGGGGGPKQEERKPPTPPALEARRVSDEKDENGRGHALGTDRGYDYQIYFAVADGVAVDKRVVVAHCVFDIELTFGERVETAQLDYWEAFTLDRRNETCRDKHFVRTDELLAYLERTAGIRGQPDAIRVRFTQTASLGRVADPDWDYNFADEGFAYIASGPDKAASVPARGARGSRVTEFDAERALVLQDEYTWSKADGPRVRSWLDELDPP